MVCSMSRRHGRRPRTVPHLGRTAGVVAAVEQFLGELVPRRSWMSAALAALVGVGVAGLTGLTASPALAVNAPQSTVAR